MTRISLSCCDADVDAEKYNHVRPGIIRFWAWLDLVAGLAMALPPIAFGFAKLIFALNHLIGGTASLPVFAPVHWLIVFICGVFILNWGVVRLLYPIGLFAIIDGYLKLWIGALLVYAIVALDAGLILWVFVFNAAVSTLTQLAAVYWPRLRKPITTPSR